MRIFETTVLSLAVATLCRAQGSTFRCQSDALSFPDIPGTYKTTIAASIKEDYQTGAGNAQDSQRRDVTLSFCSVTVKYSHQDWDDQVTVSVWLPLHDWNGRLKGVGGGGFASQSGFGAHAWAVSHRYAAVGTDAGHAMDGMDPSTWALDESGHVNFFLLQNFFTISQHEASIIGKHIVEGVYGHGPRFSYWDGCSTGGRQGLMLAQRYPDAYDGILAGAPAINWATFVPGMYYPQFVMNQAQHYPPMCVFDFATDAAIKACDSLDDITDNIISHPDKCAFSAHSLTEQLVSCDNESRVFDQKDAEVVQDIWDGPKWKDGTPMWFGLPRGTSFRHLANSQCNGTVCTEQPFAIASNWIGLFVHQNRTFDLSTLPADGFASAMSRSIAAFKSVSSTDNPDLKDFKDAGGKLLHWHGTADTQIYEPGSIHYWNRVEARDPDVRDYYRFFQAPGAAHCEPGDGFQPSDPLSQLVDWVENGKAPDTLLATNSKGASRVLRPYPLGSINMCPVGNGTTKTADQE